MEDVHSLHALDELDVLGKLVDALVELEEELGERDGARELDVIVHEVLREVLPRVHGLVGLGWLRLNLNLGGLVAPQVLELHGVVVLGVVRRHLVQLGVDALALPLHVGVVVAVFVLVQKPLEFDVVGALESRCHVED